jgi:hypothetical protein
MTPSDLANWQARLGLSQIEAAGLLKMPVQTYRNLLRGRRHSGSLPGPIAELCDLVERRTGAGPKTPMPHEITAEEIRTLDERSLVELLSGLLHVEAEAAGLPRSGIHVPSQINVADEGEDGRIEWSGGPTHTSFLPARAVLFQAKATDMAPAKCAAEMYDKGGVLKVRIREAIERGGTYVIFCNRQMTQAKIDDRTAKMREVLKKARLNGMSTASVMMPACREDWLPTGCAKPLAAVLPRPVARPLKSPRSAATRRLVKCKGIAWRPIRNAWSPRRSRSSKRQRRNKYRHKPWLT